MDQEEVIIIKKKKLVVKKKLVQEQVVQDPIQEYIANLSEIEKKVLEIAIKNLESSFCIEKSIGFLAFQKLKQKN